MERRQLILMRHATAGSSRGRDHERTLTPRGLDEARRVGARLRIEGPHPQRVLCSSATRCRETWQAVAAGLGATAADAPIVEFQDRLYASTPSTLADAIAAVEEEQTLLVLAHNPGISQLAFELGRGREEDEARLRTGFRPAAIACYDVDGPWSLISARTAKLTRFEGPPSEV
jgi:phosphohistidine phosphatase